MKFFTKYVIRILDCLVKNPEKGLPDPELDAIIDIESKRYALPDAMT